MSSRATMATVVSATLEKNRVYCPHCEKKLSKTTFYAHKRLYFNQLTRKWSKSRVNFAPSTAVDDDITRNDDLDQLLGPSEEEHDEEAPFDFEQPEESLAQAEQSSALREVDGSTKQPEDVSPPTSVCTDEYMGTEVWDDFSDSDEGDEDQSSNSFSSLLKLYSFFLLMFQGLFRLSDTAMNVLLTFFAMFFATLARKVPSLPQSFISNLPATKHAACGGKKRLEPFKKYVCCSSCHALYSWEECIIQTAHGQVESKLCSYQEFPYHPQAHHRNPCGNTLMKKVKSSKGILSLYPRLIYCYCSVIESLKEMVIKPGFIDRCELWREQNSPEGIYCDIYDGKIWKEFMSVDGVPFLSAPFNFAFQLNVDWFQPFKHTKHAEGAIYLSILNLPRQERFLKENVLLVGVIPGPKEPALHINSLLQPLVNELKELWEGVRVKTLDSTSVIIRAALICVACDIPAGRKVCGFMGHKATMGCSKCLLPFPTESFGDKADYSNFDRKVWLPRTNTYHRTEAKKWCACNTKTHRVETERKSGVRYSCLLQLPYFDAPRMCVIDPMHNMLLGTAKMVLELWKSMDIIKEKDFDEIQRRVDSFTCPSDVGRLPLKISSSFSGFTAEQWKNWTIFFSLYALKGVLPWNQYNCWQLFVKASWLFCRRSISVTELEEGDKIIMEFCNTFASINGPENCTINMHLHGHLRQCIEDFGPVYSFWCFSFKRLNGILGSYHTNSHHISVQLTRRFLESKIYAPQNWPIEFTPEYLPLLQRFNYLKGSLRHTTLENETSCATNNNVCPLPPVKECAFLPHELEELQTLVCSQVCILHYRCSAIMLSKACNVVGAKHSRHSQSSLLLCRRNDSEDIGLAEVRFFVQCNVKSDCGEKSSWMAAVSWYMPHDCSVWFGKPTQVWTTTQYPGYCFIPVSYIKSRVVYTKASVNFGRMIGLNTVYVIAPLDM